MKKNKVTKNREHKKAAKQNCKFMHYMLWTVMSGKIIQMYATNSIAVSKVTATNLNLEKISLCFLQILQRKT